MAPNTVDQPHAPFALLRKGRLPVRGRYSLGQALEAGAYGINCAGIRPCDCASSISRSGVRSWRNQTRICSGVAFSRFEVDFASNGGTAITSACKSANGEILRAGKNSQIGVAAKLGCAWKMRPTKRSARDLWEQHNGVQMRGSVELLHFGL